MAEAEAGAGSAAGQGPVVLQAGQVIQNYEIVKPLGKGKFSIVYMAKRLTDGTMCALKKINIFDMMVPKQREKCLKEVRLLQSMDHPNIVRLKESFIDNNELLIIVEWAEKGDLKRLIRRAISMDIRFKDTEIWEYSRQLSSALDHMHAKRIMHRDLKPANIFVAMDGSLKLGDLGLGRFFSSQTLEAFSKVGTPLYMSPEVLRGAGYDMRSDVWSLGCVLYELAMLRSPFKSEQQLSLYDLFVRISKGEYPPLPETVSADFRELVGMMLALDPTKRLDCAQVLEVCTARVAALAAQLRKDDVGLHKAQQPAAGPTKVCRPSPLLVMDDIVEKLKLLECEEQFLRPRGYPILHRCFFVQKAPLTGKTTQFEVMYDLIQWLLAQVSQREAADRQGGFAREEAADASAGPPCKKMSRPSAASAGPVAEADAGAGDAAAGRGALPSSCLRSAKGDPDDLLKEVVHQLAGRGIQISSDATLAQLQQGYGEGVCLILNELINQELVGRDFHFEEPLWVEAMAKDRNPIEVPAEEIEEDYPNSESECSQDAESEGQDSETNANPTPGYFVIAIMESLPGQKATAGSFEPVHETHVDVEAWRSEAERVRPLLRISSDALSGPLASWQGTVSKTRELCLRIRGLCKQLSVPEAFRATCSKWQQQLEDIRFHEERLNARFSERVAESGRLRSEVDKETEKMHTLQSSIASLSEVLSTVAEELEKKKNEAAGHVDAAMDGEQLPRLRKAFQRLRHESNQLELRIGCVQADLLARDRTARSRKRASGGCADPAWFHGPLDSDETVRSES